MKRFIAFALMFCALATTAVAGYSRTPDTPTARAVILTMTDNSQCELSEATPLTYESGYANVTVINFVSCKPFMVFSHYEVGCSPVACVWSNEIKWRVFYSGRYARQRYFIHTGKQNHHNWHRPPLCRHVYTDC